MKVGLFINTQFPEGLNLPERVPDAAQVRAARATPVSRLSGSRCPMSTRHSPIVRWYCIPHDHRGSGGARARRSAQRLDRQPADAGPM
jgi:hypothetical protein